MRAGAFVTGAGAAYVGNEQFYMLLTQRANNVAFSISVFLLCVLLIAGCLGLVFGPAGSVDDGSAGDCGGREI